MTTKFAALLAALKSVSVVVVVALVLVQRAGADQVKPLPGSAPLTEINAAAPVLAVKEGAPVERNYRQQPPLIPHRIDRYEIDRNVNQCLRCHDWPDNARENAPMVSVSHYLDRDGNKLDRVSSGRWFCVQCHVPQADARPLVDNTFHPAGGR